MGHKYKTNLPFVTRKTAVYPAVIFHTKNIFTFITGKQRDTMACVDPIPADGISTNVAMAAAHITSF